MSSPIKNMAYWRAKNAPVKQKRVPKSTNLDKLMDKATEFEGTKTLTKKKDNRSFTEKVEAGDITVDGKTIHDIKKEKNEVDEKKWIDFAKTLEEYKKE